MEFYIETLLHRLPMLTTVTARFNIQDNVLVLNCISQLPFVLFGKTALAKAI